MYAVKYIHLKLLWFKNKIKFYTAWAIIGYMFNKGTYNIHYMYTLRRYDVGGNRR